MHLALILDGNRRWAQKQGLVKMLGHTKGSDNIEPILRLCIKENIEYVSMWALAKKNIEERGQDELSHIYTLIRTRFVEMVPQLIENSIRFFPLGDLDLMPTDIKKILLDTQEKTRGGTKCNFILCIGYGGQHEILRGIKKLLKKNIDQLTPENIDRFLENLDEAVFGSYLDEGSFPAPDLIVRTGGDTRHSGYYLYSCEYSEYYFTPTFWPDFDEVEFYKALDSLKGAKRNFGK